MGEFEPGRPFDVLRSNRCRAVAVVDDQADPLAKLTDRERAVLGMTAEGFSSSEIGEKLFISPKTVDTYRSRIMEKLQLHHRSELVRFALNTGLLKAK